MWVVVVSALRLPWTVVANQDLLTRQTDDNQWALPSKNYAGTRYSSLNQITAGNVKNLHQVWSFSTGALRGHEGQPLVVGSTMYVHSAYPNHVPVNGLCRSTTPCSVAPATPME